MDQLEAFHEDWRDALGTAALHYESPNGGRGKKAFAADLWPQKKREEAYDQWKNCMNPDRSHKFGPEDIVRAISLLSAAGVHCFMYHLADEGHYNRPQCIAPEQAKQNEQAEIRSMIRNLDRKLARFERRWSDDD